MARPKKHADEMRSETARCRLTVSEREAVRMRAAQAGLQESEFIRRRILNVPLPVAQSGSDPALVSALNNYVLALAQIGNNVNQLAAATHQGRDFTNYWREVGDELEQDLDRARRALNVSLEDLAE